MKRTLFLQLIFGFSAIFVFLTSTGNGQEMKEMPVVLSGGIPIYPLMARTARIEGTVVLKVMTDGTSVSQIDVKSGPPMLAAAAKENVSTWKFLSHTPTWFEVTFQFHISEPASCGYENGTTTLKLPTLVEINVNVLQTCDPSSHVSKIIKK